MLSITNETGGYDGGLFLKEKGKSPARCFQRYSYKGISIDEMTTTELCNAIVELRDYYEMRIAEYRRMAEVCGFADEKGRKE